MGDGLDFRCPLHVKGTHARLVDSSTDRNDAVSLDHNRRGFIEHPRQVSAFSIIQDVDRLRIDRHAVCEAKRLHVDTLHGLISQAERDAHRRVGMNSGVDVGPRFENFRIDRRLPRGRTQARELLKREIELNRPVIAVL